MNRSEFNFYRGAQVSTDRWIGLNFKKGTQVSTDRLIGPNFKQSTQVSTDRLIGLNFNSPGTIVQFLDIFPFWAKMKTVIMASCDDFRKKFLFQSQVHEL